MCGIVGIVGKQAVAPAILDALKRLEYRGYDSAGVATLEGSRIERRRAEGKLFNLQERLSREPLAGHIGIGHTRWATHGAPTERNAHPHATKRVAVVHNGIIENFRELKLELVGQGVRFETETDTEVVAHLVTQSLEAGNTPQQAMHQLLQRIDGAFALAIMFDGNDNLLAAARKGSPLAVGIGNGEMYLGSDAIALAPFTSRVIYLDDGDWALITRDTVDIFDHTGQSVTRPEQRSTASAALIDKGNHRHFMAKEIYEQPEVVGHTAAHYLDFGRDRLRAPEKLGVDFNALKRLSISACGTAYYAGLIARYWFERLARIPVDIDIGSEFRYRETPMEPGGLALFISQSGETADTLATLRYCRENGQTIGAVVNVRESTIAREADLVFPTLAGTEVGVASTKAFTCQLTTLVSLAIAAGRARGVLSEADEEKLVRAVAEVPRHCAEALRLEPQIETLSRNLMHAQHVLYLGRGTSFPLALEGALKLKEISYIHAEGYAAGELKHGPIALIDEHMPVVLIAPYDRVFEKTVSNMQEVAARGGQIILLTDKKGAEEAGSVAKEVLVMPEMPQTIAPIVYTLPVQLLAYHTAVLLGTDVDQPRNLAKSVTVE